MRITYIGGPTALLEVAGWRLICDPTFDPAGRRYFFGWGTMSRKLQGPARRFEELGPIDAVLLSHDHHGDNLDPTGRALLPRMGRILTTASGALRLGADGLPVTGLRPWGQATLEAPGRPTITVTATPCRHGPPGSGPIVGDVIGFALAHAGQRHGQVWLTGDTVLYPGLREVPGRLDVGTAIVNLGGVRFPWLSGPLRYTLDAAAAIELLTEVDPRTVVPLHTEGWSHFRQPRAEAERELAASRLADRVVWPPAGEAIELET